MSAQKPDYKALWEEFPGQLYPGPQPAWLRYQPRYWFRLDHDTHDEWRQLNDEPEGK